MRKIINIFLIVLSGTLLTGCMNKKYLKQESIFIVFKTPALKYADLGFVYERSDEIKVEMYGSGHAVLSLTISEEKVCMSSFQCMDKKSFNHNVLSQWYPETILEHIFKGERIFNAKGLSKTRNGFTQTLVKKDKYNINYSVLNKQIIFHDTINNILIKVKRLK